MVTMRWSQIDMRPEMKDKLTDSGWDWCIEPMPIEMGDVGPGDIIALPGQPDWRLVVATRPEDPSGHLEVYIATTLSKDPMWLRYPATQETWILGARDWSSSWRTDPQQPMPNMKELLT